MSPTLDAFVRSWPWSPGLLVGLVGTAIVYARGWRELRHRDPTRWRTCRLFAFVGGLLALILALASPIEPFSALLFQAHMVQHLLLTMVAPPLIWLGAPLVPMLRGLPAPVRTYWVAPLFRHGPLRRAMRTLTHPLAALPLFILATWGWHAPWAYELALRSDAWHYLQHGCFLGTALLFWYPVVRPYPARPRWSLWALVPYLILADVQNTVLAALLAFSDRLWYPSYAALPRLGGLSALDDQAAAGVIMWVPGSVAFLLPLFAIGTNLLHGASAPAQPKGRRTTTLNAASSRLAVIGPRRQPHFDLLAIPIVGAFLRWRHARLALQAPMLGIAGLIIVDGLRGPRLSAMNLAGALPWIHWRGLLVLGLLVLGNVSCTACPFLVPRTLARRWFPARWSWPRRLRSKWLAVALMVLFLWSYEAFALWDRPWLTATIALAYFSAAFLIDGAFRGASFCKYVCPIGQFNFVQSLVSPFEIQARDTGICASCQTKECIRGREDLSGCETGLFLPRKVGNLDCTFCLDCVHACPHDNVGLIARPPGKSLLDDSNRSGIGHVSRRPDLAALVLVVVFGAFSNAAGMVAPVVNWLDNVSAALGLSSSIVSLTVFNVLALLVLPLVLTGLAASLSRHWGRLSPPRLELATRFAFALVPIGFAMWLSHYGLHLVTSWETVFPVTQRFARDLGVVALGPPQWARACCPPVAEWAPRLEVLVLDVGLLFSLYCAYQIASGLTERPTNALKALFPWAVLIGLLFAAGVWIILQPMEMRGTLLRSG